MTALAVEHKLVSTLVPALRNARTHSKHQIAQIAASIQRFGFCNPILLDQDDRVVAGHGRLLAAKKLGLERVPAVRLSHLTAKDRQAYALADNRLAELANWDQDLLALEIRDLIDVGFDLSEIGFEPAQVDLILNNFAEAEDSPRRGEEKPLPLLSTTPVTRRGDVWVLDRHRLLCGDARDKTCYEAVLQGREADLVFTDPPYNVPIKGHVSGHGKVSHREFEMAVGEMSEQQFIDFLSRSLGCAVSVSRSGAVHFICMDWRHCFEVLSAGRQLYDDFLNVCVWNKSNGGMGSFYRSKHEFVFVFKVGGAPHSNNIQLGQHGRYRTNVWDYPGYNSFGALRDDALAMHPTVKPTALVADAIQDASRRGDCILDPFAGSGTTLLAAEQTGRHAAVIETDPSYCDLILNRWQAQTGHKAYHSESGLSFEDCSDQRAEGALSEVRND